jgi:ABC-2 type transport system ATP-binding protein
LRRRVAAGTTVFMSTHTLSVAEEIAHRIGIIDEGRLDFLGTQGQLEHELALAEKSLEHLFLQLTGGGNGRGVPADQTEPAR